MGSVGGRRGQKIKMCYINVQKPMMHMVIMYCKYVLIKSKLKMGKKDLASKLLFEIIISVSTLYYKLSL